MPSKKAADLGAGLIGTKGQVPRPATTEANSPLNFKVSADVKRRFRILAANEGKRLNELLVSMLEDRERNSASS